MSPNQRDARIFVAAARRIDDGRSADPYCALTMAAWHDWMPYRRRAMLRARFSRFFDPSGDLGRRRTIDHQSDHVLVLLIAAQMARTGDL